MRKERQRVREQERQRALLFERDKGFFFWFKVASKFKMLSFVLLLIFLLEFQPNSKPVST